MDFTSLLVLGIFLIVVLYCAVEEGSKWYLKRKVLQNEKARIELENKNQSLKRLEMEVHQLELEQQRDWDNTFEESLKRR